MTWLAQAEAFALDAAELGPRCAVVHIQAWEARVMPEACAGLAGAAIALGVTSASLVGRPLRTDKEMLSHTGDLEADAAVTLGRARDLHAGVRRAWEAACARLRAATEARAAGYAPAQSGRAAAAERAAERDIADCEAALDVLDELTGRLDYALSKLQQLPDDLATTYEVPYVHIRSGRQLPRDGDFLTGAGRELAGTQPASRQEG